MLILVWMSLTGCGIPESPLGSVELTEAQVGALPRLGDPAPDGKPVPYRRLFGGEVGPCTEVEVPTTGWSLRACSCGASVCQLILSLPQRDIEPGGKAMSRLSRGAEVRLAWEGDGGAMLWTEDSSRVELQVEDLARKRRDTTERCTAVAARADRAVPPLYEGVDPADVEATLEHGRQRILACVERSMLANACLSGVLRVAWRIRGGLVHDAVVLADNTSDPAFAPCLLSAVEQLRFFSKENDPGVPSGEGYVERSWALSYSTTTMPFIPADEMARP